jgi:hypothetical protein
MPRSTAKQNPFTPEKMALYKEVTALTMKVARPLVWHDVGEPYPKRLLGGTCFVLRFHAGLIGITAAHVIRAFEDAKKQDTKTECLLRTVPIDIVEAIIAQDDELDIVTFRVTEEQLIGSEAEAIDCTLEWPPPMPEKDTALSFAGCPEEIQTAFSHSKREFHFYVDLAFVEALPRMSRREPRDQPEGTADGVRPVDIARRLGIGRASVYRVLAA